MWFAETPWPPALIAFGIAIALLLRWSTHRNKAQLIAAITLLVAAGAIIGLERLIVTEGERIEESIPKLAQSVEAGDSAAVAAFFGNEEQAAIVSRYVAMVKFLEPIRISDTSVSVNLADGRAISRFRATSTVKFMDHTDSPRTRWELAWQREGNDWKIVGVKRLSFLRDAEIAFSAVD